MSKHAESADAQQSHVDADPAAAVAARWSPLVLALLVLALLLRMLAAVVVERHAQNAGRAFLIEGDANGYWELGQKLARGQAYAIHQPPRYVLRMPGFPLLLAGSIRLFGDSVLAARMILAVIGTVCCWLTWCLGKQVHTRRTAFYAALFVAVHPLHILNSVLILSETLFTLWMLTSLIALVWLVNRTAAACPVRHTAPCAWRLWLRSLLTGALIGITVLVRPGFLPWLAVAIGAVVLLVTRPVPVRCLLTGGLLIGCGLTLLPWAARNASVTGHWVVTSLWSGPSLYDGLNPNATGASDMRFFDEDNLMGRQQMTEFEMNEYYKQRASEFVRSRPARAFQLAFIKGMRFLSPVLNVSNAETRGLSGWVINAVCVALWVLLYGTAVVGLYSRQWNAMGLLSMLGPFVLFLLVHMVFVGSVRYRLPVEYPLAVLAAIGWQRLVLARTKHAEA